MMRILFSKLSAEPTLSKSKHALLLLSIVVLSSFTGEEYQLVNSIPFTNVQFTTDRFGNAFIVVENQVLEFDSLGKPKGNYSDRNSGFLTSVDASNPLKILLFYKDFARILL